MISFLILKRICESLNNYGQQIKREKNYRWEIGPLSCVVSLFYNVANLYTGKKFKQKEILFYFFFTCLVNCLLYCKKVLSVTQEYMWISSS